MTYRNKKNAPGTPPQHYNLIQDLTIRHKTSDRAERQFTQLLLSDGGQKKPAGKNPVGKKSAGKLGRNHGSNSK